MKQKIYNLLMVTYRGLLENTFKQVFFSDTGLAAVKTFDDYLTDFYLYLYEAKPKYVTDDVKGYYLQQIKDENATPAWLRQTFRRFLLEENKILTEMREALAEYRRQLASAKAGISSSGVPTSISWDSIRGRMTIWMTGMWQTFSASHRVLCGPERQDSVPR